MMAPVAIGQRRSGLEIFYKTLTMMFMFAFVFGAISGVYTVGRLSAARFLDKAPRGWREVLYPQEWVAPLAAFLVVFALLSALTLAILDRVLDH